MSACSFLTFTFFLFPDKALKEIVERILQTSYFDSTHNHQNGLCEEEEAAPTPAVEDAVAEAGKSMNIHCDQHVSVVVSCCFGFIRMIKLKM